MGLDMYLEARLYVGGQFEHRKVTGTIDMKLPEGSFHFDAKRVSSLSLQVGYWRKANQIHHWFVEHVQAGQDDCRDYYVSRNKLIELKAACLDEVEARETEKAGSFLQPTAGFFFGPTDIDEWYYTNIEETVEIINKALALPEDYDFFYQSSW